MPALKILLIEDSTADQVLFVSQFQDQSGLEVQCDCASTIGEAFSYLEAARDTPYDQVWLDPGLPDLKPSAIGQVLASLKKHVEPGELRLLSSTASPEVARQAKQQDVALLHKDALSESSSEILEILKTLATKRSGSGTVRIEQARQEGRILSIENAVQSNASRLDRLEAALGNLGTVRFELESIKNAIAAIPQIQQTLSELKTTTQQQGAIKVQRLTTLQAIVVALLGAAAVVLAAVVPKLLEQNAPKPSPSPSVSASPRA